MIVRKATRADASAITAFQLAMALETENLKLDAQTVEQGVRGVFEEPARGNYYVAEKHGEVIGSLLTTFEWSDWRNGTVLWIQSVYVLPGHRRSGVYKSMYRYLQQMVAEEPSLRGIRLYADISNAVAHQTYRSLGMNDDHYQTFEWMKQS